MNNLFATAAALALSATAALAGEITLSEEIQGATLHEAGVDMSVYYLDKGAVFETVATYAAPGAETGRMRMGLMDGDSVSFALPGQMQTTYTFARSGAVVTVSAQSEGELALAE